MILKTNYRFYGKNIIISNCKKIENLKLKDFDRIEIENGDLSNLDYTCNILRYYNCKNIEKTNIKYNVLEKITKDI